MTTYTFFAPCPRGLEDCLANEIKAQHAHNVVTHGGGVAFEGSFETCYRVNLHSRIASRVLLHIARAPYRNEQDVYHLAHTQDWLQWFAVDTTLRVDVTGRNCPLKSLDFITLRIKDAICDYYRAATDQRPDIDTEQPHMHVQAFLDATHCTLYLDTSGDALFKRGWRQAKGDAPLRENLAAGILQLSGWTPEQVLYDPMCGSGTFLAEAAQIALEQAPGLMRGFAFMRMQNFAVEVWRKLYQEACEQHAQRCKFIGTDLHIYGSDISPKLVAISQENLARALPDNAQRIHLKQIDFLDSKPPAVLNSSGIMLCNPPYGERITAQGRGTQKTNIETPTLAARGTLRLPTKTTAPAEARMDSDQESYLHFMEQFSRHLKQHYAGWNVFILSADLQLPQHLRLKPKRKTPLFNGALECRLFQFEMVAGSNRK